MQLAGQTSLHCGSSSAPTHSVHFNGSMTYIGFPAVIALFGQTGSQASQAVQASVIISAICLSSHFSRCLRNIADGSKFLEPIGAPERCPDRSRVDCVGMATDH